MTGRSLYKSPELDRAHSRRDASSLIRGSSLAGGVRCRPSRATRKPSEPNALALDGSMASASIGLRASACRSRLPKKNSRSSEAIRHCEVPAWMACFKFFRQHRHSPGPLRWRLEPQNSGRAAPGTSIAANRGPASLVTRSALAFVAGVAVNLSQIHAQRDRIETPSGTPRGPDAAAHFSYC